MTDKQIIIDGVDVSGCPYYIDSDGSCSSHDCECIKCIHNVCFYKDYKAKEQECEALQMSENEAGEIIAELQAYKDINEDFKTAWEELKAENEELKKIINEAKNSNLDLKSFLVGEAVQNEYEQQLDQLKAENESLKDSLKMFSSTLDWALKSQVGLYKRQIDSSVPDDWEYEEVLVLVEQYIEKLKQTLAEIKEIAEGMHDLWINKTPYTDINNLVKHILECELNRIRYKLDEIIECEVENDNK